MVVENFQHIGERLKEERLRIAYAQVAFADACAINRGTLSNWEKGEQTPSAAALGVMANLGVDVLYVVTGQRAGQSESTLAPAERELLQAWRHGTEQGRKALVAMADALKPK
ncbi:MAG: helix-turn-helix domain-containing protein [Acidovorax sp.]|jgi:transcriptional regulator with XRE-family HTH domain|nr:helix-turn-helix domain-containing protein [Acidovorax sp.]